MWATQRNVKEGAMDVPHDAVLLCMFTSVADRRDCLDHVVIFGGQDLRHLLSSYLQHYNEVSHAPIIDKRRTDCA
jgi:hypothetical protein